MHKIQNNMTISSDHPKSEKYSQAANLTPDTFENSTDWFLAQPLHRVDFENARIAYRRIGSGPALLMLHGYPVSGLTYRHLIPYLRTKFTCYIVDIPGFGESEWTEGMDFHFEAQAQRLKKFINAVGLKRYSVLAHDTGATLARLLALVDARRLEAMVLLNTEIPGHRTPWIPLYTALFRIPGIDLTLRWLLRWRAYLGSAMAFKSFYFDPSLLNDDFIRCNIRPLLTKKLGLVGMRRYLIGFDWSILDSLQTRHSEIKAPVLLIWGEDDPTFPIKLARQMAHQFKPTAQFKSIPNAKLMPHEERPEDIAHEAILFLQSLPLGVHSE